MRQPTLKGHVIVEGRCEAQARVSRALGDCAKKIERSGGHVLTDMCTVVSWTEILGIKTMMTKSAKTAYYARTLNKTETVFAPLKQCLETALEG